MTEKLKTFEDITGIDTEEVKIPDMDKKEKNENSKGIIIDEFDQINSMPSGGKKITDNVSIVEHDLSSVKKHGRTDKLEYTGVSPAERVDNLTIKISGSAGKKILEDFNVSDIGNIDLREAEEIAGEDMLFLTESDLIEGLEEFELIPLVDTDKTDEKKDILLVEKTADQEVSRVEKVSNKAADLKERQVSSVHVPDTDGIEVEIVEEQTYEAPSKVSVKEEQHVVNGDKTILQNEKVQDIFDMPLIIEDDSRGELNTQENSKEFFDSQSKVIFTDEDLVGKGSFADESMKGSNIQSNETVYENDLLEKEESVQPISSPDITMDTSEDPLEAEAVSVELTSLKKSDNSEEYFINDKPYEKFEKEILPDELQALEVIEDNVLFIDDIIIDKPDIEESVIFSGDNLEKLSSGYLDLSQVEGRVLEEDDESDVPDGRIIETSRFKEFDELAIDFEDDEYKYRDDELDFVENAIFEEDYARYIYEIDELYHIRGHKDISSAREILGLDSDDLSLIDDKLYGHEYININLDEIFNLIREETYAGALKGERFCNYFLPGGDTFLSNEKASIEEDISAMGALIFEEDIHKIKEKLGRAVASEDKKNVSITEEVFDITEKIVIIEDDLDVDRFVKELPDEKQDDMKHLLKYLDGLFEKLPEEVIKKFADSEYFDVYSKVLNQMGI